MQQIAQVCVDVPALVADKPYSYAVPEHMHLQPGMRVLVSFGKGNQQCEAMVLRYPAEPTARKLKSVLMQLDAAPILSDAQMKLAFFLRERLFCPLYSILRAMLPSGLWYTYETAYFPGKASEEDAKTACALIPGAEKVIEKLWHSEEPLPLRAFSGKIESNDLQLLLRRLLEGAYLQTTTLSHSRTRAKTDKLFALTEAGQEVLSRNSIRTAAQRDVMRMLASSGDATVKEIGYYTGSSEATVRNLVKKGYLRSYLREAFRQTEYLPEPAEPVRLNGEQEAVYQGLCEQAVSETPKFSAALLFGVTGSGKTSVYIRLIQAVREAGRDVIVLVPEISLTPQMMERFYAYFGQDVAVLHSALSVSERADAWRRIQRGDAHVVLGTRSAAFAPVAQLGLMILDEEHDHSYKSDNAPCYHAKDVAAYRCMQHKAMLLLGSATPSVTSMYAAQTGKMTLYTLDKRYGQASLPQTEIADTRAAFRQGYTGSVGPVLFNAMKLALDRREQCILFLNRRGFSRQLVCMECGHIPGCPRCSAPLHYHKANERTICHQCGYSVRAPLVCPSCGANALQTRDAGTQLIEDEVQQLFPEARIIRMDSDTTGGKHTHADLLSAFAEGKAEILIGTQMVTKGLNFPNVTVTGVLDADMSLYSPSYQSGEDTFALITQVTGRAGRAEKPGVSIIQTAAPDNEVIRAAAAQDYMRFYHSEIEIRRALHQPPFETAYQLTLSGGNDADVQTAAALLRDSLPKIQNSVEVLGPAPHPMQKLNNRYRYTLTLRSADAKTLRAFTAEAIRIFQSSKKNKQISIFADIL